MKSGGGYGTEADVERFRYWALKDILCRWNILCFWVRYYDSFSMIMSVSLTESSGEI